MKNTLLLFVLVLVVTGCTFQPSAQKVYINQDTSQAPATSTVASSSKVTVLATSSSSAVVATSSLVKKETSVPSQLLLKVAFAQQAPFGNWDELHEEACEEASIIIADSYFGQKVLDENIMEKKLQALFAWEDDNGYKVDLTAQETIDVMKKYFQRDAHLVTEVTTDRIKYELAQGNLVVIPTAGRELGNPNFKYPGPIYHMLVVVGYDTDEFITHDVGTRKGKNYHYSYAALLGAIHDWDPKLAEGGMTDQEMVQSHKVFIVVPANN